LRGGVPWYVAQASPQFDAEIAEKGHLWMETSYKLGHKKSNQFKGLFTGFWHLDSVAKIIISAKNSLL
jgi:hypothetical protein